MPWWNDFNWSARGVVVKETGARVRFDAALANDLARWFPYYFAELGRGLFGRLGRPAFTIAFAPVSPRPWYLIWGVTRRAGGRVVSNPHKADAVFYFEDRTTSRPPPRPNPLAPGFNYFCEDISKSNVAEVFDDAFGYSLAVDPTSYIGPIVVKSERNGVHDGRIESGPIKKERQMAYQRLIDNEIQPGFVVDFRCPTVKGEIPLVYIKVRPKDQRFDNVNSSVALAKPEDVFSPAELDKISAFCSDMGLDWGGIDVLRDKTDGRIYIVDVNKTDMGPPLALPLKDKLRSVDILSEALADAIIGRPGMIPHADTDALDAANDTSAAEITA